MQHLVPVRMSKEEYEELIKIQRSLKQPSRSSTLRLLINLYQEEH